MTTPSLALDVPSRLCKLLDHVHRCYRGRIRDFRVLVHDGGLVLRGFVRSYHVKQLIQNNVMKMMDLPITANEIEVG